MTYVVLDVGGSGIKCAVMDKEANILHKHRIEIHQNYDGFIKSIIEFVKDMQSKYTIEGVCISSPGTVNAVTGYIHGVSAIPYIHFEPNIPRDIYEATKLPVSIENDANCAALGEVYYGKHNVNDMVFFICGSGIGGSIIKDRRVHKGSNLIGGELGCMLVGKRDNRFVTLSEICGFLSILDRIKRETGEALNGLEVFKRAEKKEEPYYTIVEDIFEYLAAAMYNIQHMYDPEIIIVGGAISERDDFVPRISEKMQGIRAYNNQNAFDFNVAPCTFYNDSNLYGALANFLQGNIVIQ